MTFEREPIVDLEVLDLIKKHQRVEAQAGPEAAVEVLNCLTKYLMTREKRTATLTEYVYAFHGRRPEALGDDDRYKEYNKFIRSFRGQKDNAVAIFNKGALSPSVFGILAKPFGGSSDHEPLLGGIHYSKDANAYHGDFGISLFGVEPPLQSEGYFAVLLGTTIRPVESAEGLYYPELEFADYAVGRFDINNHIQRTVGYNDAQKEELIGWLDLVEAKLDKSLGQQ